MSRAAERPGQQQLPPAWDRLERAARETAAQIGAWRRRALEAEEEVGRLRRALEEMISERASQEEEQGSGGAPPSREAREEIRRLRAENLALRTRMTQARRRVAVLLKRLPVLEARE